MLQGLNHITIAVTDLERSLNFYTHLLGMTSHVRWDKGAYLSLGDAWFCLSSDKAKPSQDYCYIALDVAENNFNAFAEKVVNTPNEHPMMLFKITPQQDKH